jgi:hypothetical protein
MGSRELSRVDLLPYLANKERVSEILKASCPNIHRGQVVCTIHSSVPPQSVVYNSIITEW